MITRFFKGHFSTKLSLMLTLPRCVVWTYEMPAMSRQWRPSAGPETLWSSCSSLDSTDLRYCISEKLTKSTCLVIQCATNTQVRLHNIFVLLRSQILSLNHNTQQVQRKSAVYILLDNSIRSFSNVCVVVCGISILCTLFTRLVKQTFI